MAETSTNSSAAGERSKRRRLATKLPQQITLARCAWQHDSQFHGSIPREAWCPAGQVQILADPKNLMILRLLNRGCQRYSFPRAETLPRKSYYVGIEGADFLPVLIRGGLSCTLDMGNHYRGVPFAANKAKKTGSFVIPPLDMLRSRQMTFLKAQAMGKDKLPSNQPKMREVSSRERQQYEIRQLEDFREGRVCSVLVENEKLDLDYAALPSTTPDSWMGFRMWMPKIAGAAIPGEITDKIAFFLSKYPLDLVEVTFAVSMALVWCRLYSSPGHQPEACTIKPGTSPSEGIAVREVPLPRLSVFLLYAPHFFRFHEEHRLAAYGHIFRYVENMYSRDRESALSARGSFFVDDDAIDEHAILDLYTKCGLQSEDWLEIVPPSFEGSQLVMPRNRGNRAPRSEETTASLMLPDIHAVGFPDYSNNSMNKLLRNFREVIVHEKWVTLPVLLESSVVRDYTGPSYLTMNAMERYSTEDTPKLWSTPRTIVRTPWRDATEAEPQADISDTASRSVAGQTDNTNGRSVESQAAQISQSNAEAFLKSIIVQLRVAKEKGQIPPDVHLSNSGLTWDSMPETMKKVSQLHPSIDIEKLVADDVARQADLLSKREKTALQKVFVDLETARNIPHCIRPLQREVDPLAEDLAKSTIFPLLKDMSRPLATAMDTISAFVDVSRYDDEGFVKSIIRPCCVLLGIEYPGSSAAGHRAIHEVDGEMGMAISEMMHLVLVPNSGNLRAAVGEFKLSNKFLPSWRFLLFKDKLMGVDFDEQRKKIWAKAFGEPYDDVVDIPSDSEMEDV